MMLKESDYIALFEQIPIRDVFQHILQVPQDGELCYILLHLSLTPHSLTHSGVTHSLTTQLTHFTHYIALIFIWHHPITIHSNPLHDACLFGGLLPKLTESTSLSHIT